MYYIVFYEFTGLFYSPVNWESFNLLNTLKESNEALNTTILMVTHDAYAASFANRILIFKDGRIIRELFKQNDDRHTFYESIAREVAKLDTER